MAGVSLKEEQHLAIKAHSFTWRWYEWFR